MAEITDITILKNGPVRVQGKIVVKDADGKEFDLAGRNAFPCVVVDTRKTSLFATVRTKGPVFNPK